MYVATFICDDRNGDDGIYGSEHNTIDAHRFATVADALHAIADDADSHAAMYDDTAERHWHGKLTTAAAYFRTDATLRHVTAMIPAFRNGYAYSVEGDDDGNGNSWRLGEYRITLDPDAPRVARTASGATINLTDAQCERLRTACDIIREDDDADDTERTAIATLCDDLYHLLRAPSSSDTPIPPDLVAALSVTRRRSIVGDPIADGTGTV